MSALRAPEQSYGQLVREAGGSWNGDTITFTPDALVRFAATVNTGRTTEERAAPDLLAAALDVHAFHKAEGDRAERQGNRPAALKLHRYFAGQLSAAIAKVTGSSP